MQQVIYLESHDLLMMKTGKTIQLAVGGATVMLGYMGRTYRKNGTNGQEKRSIEGEPMLRVTPKRKGHRPWNKGHKMNKRPKKRPCRVCGRHISPLGFAPHMAMHVRNGDAKVGEYHAKE